jgi:hypothetical protein
LLLSKTEVTLTSFNLPFKWFANVWLNPKHLVFRSEAVSEAEEEHVTTEERNFLVSPISACNVNDEDDDDDEVEEDEEEEDDDDAVASCRA